MKASIPGPDTASSECDDDSPDHADRIQDFLSRHGGPGVRGMSAGESPGGIRGWSEIYAADGYALRCDWSLTGSRKEMKYVEMLI